MENQYTVESLRERIKELELQQVEEGKQLKVQLIATYENLKPINIIKSVVHDFATSDGVRDELVNSAAGFATGLITKKLIVGSSKNPLLKLVGLAIQFGLTTIISKNYGAVKDLFSEIVSSFIAKMQEPILPENDETSQI